MKRAYCFLTTNSFRVEVEARNVFEGFFVACQKVKDSPNDCGTVQPLYVTTDRKNKGFWNSVWKKLEVKA